MDYNEFTNRIKAKYPDYNDMDNLELAQKIVDKYPKEYADVTFDTPDVSGQNGIQPLKIQENNTPVLEGSVQKNRFGVPVDFDPYNQKLPIPNPMKGVLQGLSSFGAGIGKNFVNNKIRPMFGKEPLSNERLDRIYGFLDDKPEGFYEKAGALTGELAPFALLPQLAPFKGAGLLSKGGNLLTNAAVQGGLPTALETMKNGGNGLIGGTTGTGIAAALNAVLPKGVNLVGKGMSAIANSPIATPIKYVTNRIMSTAAGLKPETITKAIQPQSRALDLSADEAQQLLLDTTQKVRADYADLLNQRGKDIRVAVNNLSKDKGVSIKQLNKDLRDIYNQYNESGDISLNKAYKAAGKEFNQINDMLEAAKTPQAQIDRANFEQSYQDLLDGTLNPREELTILSETPEIWKNYGLPNNTIKTSQNVLKKAGNLPNDFDTNHYLDEKVIRNLPDLLQDPSHILNSSTVDGRYVGILDAVDADGRPVAAILAPNEKNLGITFMPSAYGRNNFDDFIAREKEAGNLLYERAQSPQVPATIAGGENYAPKDIISSLPENINASPQKLYDIIKSLPKTDWKSADAETKDKVLRQVYNQFNSRLSEMSPELAGANKAYSDLMDFKNNDAVNQVLRGDLYNEGTIGSAPTALKNYRANVTSGNRAKNIYELENILYNNGYGTFTDKIDDVNAAQDLVNSIQTGRNYGGITDYIKMFGVRPLLQSAREINRANIPYLLQTADFQPANKYTVPTFLKIQDAFSRKNDNQ